MKAQCLRRRRLRIFLLLRILKKRRAKTTDLRLRPLRGIVRQPSSASSPPLQGLRQEEQHARRLLVACARKQTRMLKINGRDSVNYRDRRSSKLGLGLRRPNAHGRLSRSSVVVVVVDADKMCACILAASTLTGVYCCHRERWSPLESLPFENAWLAS